MAYFVVLKPPRMEKSLTAAIQRHEFSGLIATCSSASGVELVGERTPLWKS
jgi:hypothetical protein